MRSAGRRWRGDSTSSHPNRILEGLLAQGSIGLQPSQSGEKALHRKEDNVNELVLAPWYQSPAGGPSPWLEPKWLEPKRLRRALYGPYEPYKALEASTVVLGGFMASSCSPISWMTLGPRREPKNLPERREEDQSSLGGPRALKGRIRLLRTL